MPHTSDPDASKVATRHGHAALGEDVRRREVWAWAMYDFANSGYTTVVITAVFNAYFVSVVAAGAAWATFAWTAALAASYLLIIVTGPLLGAYADAHAAKKRLLLVTTAGCVTTTAALYGAGPGSLAWAIAFLIASNYCYGSGENLIAAFLPELASSRAMGRVSGWGWSFGYLGGLVSLGASLAYITHAQAHGQSARDFVPVSMLITAALFALAATPTFLFLRERAVPQATAVHRLAGASWQRLAHTLRHLGDFRDLARFLTCTVFYQAGIATVISLAAIYAQEAIGFKTTETLVLILVVNVTAAVGAFAFGYVQDALGHIRAIALVLCAWILTVALAWFATDRTLFWVVANFAGLSMGSAQAAGRAMVGVLSPSTRLAEFFGLWGLAVKLASAIGPLSYGLANWATAGNHRHALLTTIAYFVVGLLLLAGVRMPRGRRTALRAARTDRLDQTGAAGTKRNLPS